ncbi:MAG: hypothetical protein K9G33_11475 [Sneathiella sp.]|nr:hypothetical protein [Sneathiella sp.]
MDLKEFIIETISAIADATNELQTSYESEGVIVNPPTSHDGASVFEIDSQVYTFRHVKDVNFDVALTVGSSIDAEGKAGLKVFSAEIGGSTGASKAKEQVSRVQFSIPIALKPSASEKENLAKKNNSYARQRRSKGTDEF